MARRTRKEDALRAELVDLLSRGRAHGGFERAVRGWPVGLRGVRHGSMPHTAWELVEHLRLAQRDILDFCRERDYVEGKFPDDYWPPVASPPAAGTWEKSLRQFRADRRAMVRLIEDPRQGPFATVAAGTGATILREALILADHNAYHIGQLVALRQALGA